MAVDTIPLKSAISSTPQSKKEFSRAVKTYKQDVQDYEQEKKRIDAENARREQAAKDIYKAQVSKYEQEKKRIDAENARREREYQKKLIAYNKKKKELQARSETQNTFSESPKISTRVDDVTPEVFTLMRGGFSFLESQGKKTTPVRKVTTPDKTDELYSAIFKNYKPRIKYEPIKKLVQPTPSKTLSSPIPSPLIGGKKILEQPMSKVDDRSLGKHIFDKAKSDFLALASIPSKISKAAIKGSQEPSSIKLKKAKKAILSTKDFVSANIPKTTAELVTPISKAILHTPQKTKTRFEKVSKQASTDWALAKSKYLQDLEESKNNKDSILDQLKKDIKTPETKKQIAESLVTAVEIVSPTVISKGYGLGKSLYFKKFGTKIPAEFIYSPRAMKSPIGIDTSFTPSKTIQKFKESPKILQKINVPELKAAYANQYVAVSSAPKPLKGKTILSKLELADNYLKETGGLYGGPLGYGQPKFLGLNGTDKYTITLNPFKSITGSKPTQYLIGTESVSEFPKRFIKKDTSILKEIEKFQRSRVGKGEAYITREASLGWKKEPEIVFNIGERYKDIFTKKPIYTVIDGKTIPVKGIEILKSNMPSTLSLTDASVKPITPQFSKMLSGEAYINYYNPSFTIPYSTLASSFLNSKKSSPSKTSTFSKASILSDSKASDFPISTAPPVFRMPSTASTASTTKSILRPSDFSISEPTVSYESFGTYPSRPSVYKISYPSFSSREPILKINSYKKTTPTILKKSFPTKSSSKKVDSTKPYKIQIRSSGKWVDVKDSSKRNYFAAWNRGAELVDSYKERSFKLTPISGKANVLHNSFTLKKTKFYQPAKSKALTSAYIEKSKYAIDSINELRGITYKGIAARKQKAKRRR
jgi:hypothetical protein